MSLLSAKMAIVTATAHSIQSQECRVSWTSRQRGTPSPQLYTVVNGQELTVPEGWGENAFGMQVYYSPTFLGVVPAFAIGVQKALDDGYDLIACLHDDLLIEQDGWNQEVYRIFKTCPKAGLVGFGGGLGLADPQIYQKPYDPMQLARRGFISNMRDAEAHGTRVTSAQPIAVLDGFSQIGTKEYWRGLPQVGRQTVTRCPGCQSSGFSVSATPGRCQFCDGFEGGAREWNNLFSLMESWGLVHHAYDAALGAFAKQLGYQVWLCPIACHHYGGRTAVGNAEYQAWARKQTPAGDQGFWREAHRIVYDKFRGVLPIN